MNSPAYGRVFLTFMRNSMIRDMTFRANFLIQCVSSMAWTLMNFGFYLIIFEHTKFIGVDTGWGRNQFFVFLATTWFVNSIVQAFFMPNAQEFSELIRTGNLDFALLKPIDTQFLISLQKVEWASLTNFVLGLVLLTYSIGQMYINPGKLYADKEMEFHLEWGAVIAYPFYILCGVAILYSLMISLAATSIWLGRNQSLYNFWFYITNFSRYPMEIYKGDWGDPMRNIFTFVIPVLVVVNVPARLIAHPLPSRAWWEWPLAGFMLLATGFCLFASRWVFQRSLLSYRSASS